MANYIHTGMFLGMKNIEGYDSTLPEFEEANYPISVLSAINEMQFTQDNFFDILNNYNLMDMVDEIQNSSQIQFVFEKVYKDLCVNANCLSEIFQYHTVQDRNTERILKNI